APNPPARPLRCGPARPRAAHPGAPDVSRGALTRILVIAYREVLLLRHNPSVLSMVFMQPPMMLFLFGVCISNTPANVPWVVLDRSNTAMSRRLVAEIEHTGYVLPPRAVDGYAEVTEQLRRGDAVAALVIPHDLARDAVRGSASVQLLLDGSDPLSAARIGFYMAQVVTAFTGPRTIEPRFAAAATTSSASPFAIRQRMLFNATLRDRKFFLAALVGMLLT